MGTLVFIVIAGLLAVGLAYLIFSPQPEKNVTLEPGTAVDAGWETYRSDTYGFEIQYPPLYRVENDYEYTALGPGKDIPGVAFYIPQSMDVRTNLSSDSHVSVEKISGNECSASSFLSDSHEESNATIGDRQFSYAETSGAGAGNLYEEYVYAIPDASGTDCFAVRLFLHSTQIANYEPGTVVAFDKEGLIKTVRDMAGTLVVR